MPIAKGLHRARAQRRTQRWRHSLPEAPLLRESPTACAAHEARERLGRNCLRVTPRLLHESEQRRQQRGQERGAAVMLRQALEELCVPELEILELDAVAWLRGPAAACRQE